VPRPLVKCYSYTVYKTYRSRPRAPQLAPRLSKLAWIAPPFLAFGLDEVLRRSYLAAPIYIPLLSPLLKDKTCMIASELLPVDLLRFLCNLWIPMRCDHLLHYIICTLSDVVQRRSCALPISIRLLSHFGRRGAERRSISGESLCRLFRVSILFCFLVSFQMKCAHTAISWQLQLEYYDAIYRVRCPCYTCGA
jgi:hypothetical protein